LRARHRADSVQSLDSLMREARERPSSRPREEVPREVQEELLGRFLREQYESWPDRPLPALGGKTPRQAARSKRGRIQVRALVDEAEHAALAQPGGDSVDFGALRESLKLDRDQETGGYDTEAPEAPGAWLARDEDERLAAILGFHRRRRRALHPPTPNPRLHAMMHLIVENQLALGQPPEVRGAMARLLSDGLSRHEALHAIGEVVAEGLWTVMREKREMDREKLGARLERLGPGDHRGTAR
jgi:hypothetical protein